MATNDNSLRAPAHGFGQEVSFSFNPDAGNTPSLDAESAVAARGGVRGSPVAGGVQQVANVAPLREDPTIAVLMKAANAYLKPKIAEARAQAFVSGMQRAATGEAVKDIAEGQPWYTKIFGDSDVVEGARTYAAQAQTANLAGAMEDSMPELRKLDANAANAYYNDLVKKHMTGDAATDAAIMNGFARTMPATMRRQAKEHYAYRQEQASTAESAAIMATASLVQKRVTSPSSPAEAFRRGELTGNYTQTDDEYASEAVKLVASAVPPAGRDLESWQKARAANLVTLAQQGNFHAVGAFKGAGMMDTLPAELRTKVEQAIDTAENRTIATKLMGYAPELGRIAGEAHVATKDGPERAYAELKALNDQFRKETGIDRDLVSLDKAAGIVSDATAAYLREGQKNMDAALAKAEKLREAGDKLQAEQAMRDGLTTHFAYGNAAVAAATPGISNEVVHDQFHQVLNRSNQPTQINLMAANYGNGLYVNPQRRDFLTSRVNAAVQAGTAPQDFPGLHAEYRALREVSPMAASAYYGDNAIRMEVYDSLLDMTKPPGSRGEVAAYASAFGSMEKPRPQTLDSKELNEASKVVKAMNPSKWNVFRESAPMRPDQAPQMVDAMRRDIGLYMGLPNATLESSVYRAWGKRAQEFGDDSLGGFFIRGERGQQTLTNILKARRPGDNAAGTGTDAPQYWSGQFEAVMAERAKKLGADVRDPIAIYRSEDVNGVAVLQVDFTVPGSHMPVREVITSNDIKDYSNAAQTKAQQPSAASKPLTIGQPSMSPEAYAAGRRRLAEELRKQ